VSKQKKNLTKDKRFAHIPQVIRQFQTSVIQVLCYSITVNNRMT